jgi:ribosomal protein S18 acetylase RimI-like enzyme
VSDVDWRPITPDDPAALAAFLAEVEAVDHYGWHFDDEFVARLLADPTIDLAHGTIVAVHDGRVVAFGLLISRHEVDTIHSMGYEGSVHPEYRGQGLGGRLLDWAARAAIPLHTKRFPNVPLELQATFQATDSPTVAHFTAHGYNPARYFHEMRRDLPGERLPEVVVPEGFQIVAYRPELDEAMRLAKNEAFRDHWNFLPATPERWRTWFTGPEFQPGLSPLAIESGGGIVSLIVTHERPAMTAATGKRDAHLTNVATVRRARGQGVASALIAHVLRDATDLGYDTASLDVDSENATGALGLYVKAGFTVTGTWAHYSRRLV